MLWIAVLVACNGPLAPDCYPIVHREVFMSEDACREELEVGISLFTSQGFLVRGVCRELNAETA